MVLSLKTRMENILSKQIPGCRTALHFIAEIRSFARPCKIIWPTDFSQHLYNGKKLRVEYTQSDTTILTSVINIMRVLTTTCFGLTRGSSSGCKIRLDKLYYNAWGTLLGEGGFRGYHGPVLYQRGFH